jgi:hypothetical protein
MRLWRLGCLVMEGQSIMERVFKPHDLTEDHSAHFLVSLFTITSTTHH